MTKEDILKRMAKGWDLSLYPSGFQLVKEGCFTERISNSRFYELFRDGFIDFTSAQGHFEVDVIKLGLTPRGREIGETEEERKCKHGVKINESNAMCCIDCACAAVPQATVDDIKKILSKDKL